MSEPTANENETDRLRKQQGVLARFGKHALLSEDIDELLQRATELISEAMDINLVKILELQPGGKSMLMRAGVNWAPGVVGHVTFGAHAHSPGGYALLTKQPVISTDVSQEKRFEIPQVLVDHGVKSMVNVAIQGAGPPFGVLEVDAQKPIEFKQDDINFLQNYANLLAAAINRCKYSQELAEGARLRNIMLRELQHRVKNILTKIQAIAGRTRSSCTDLDQFMTNFSARLQAMARAQDLLTEAPSDTVDLREILRREFEAEAAFNLERVEISGDDIKIPGKDAWALNLLFHELATNAQKHGAFRFDAGKIYVSWGMDVKEHKLLLRWRETGAPIASAPSKKSFGYEIIEGIVPSTLSGKSILSYHADGIEYTIEFPIHDRMVQAASPSEGR